jgi:hypothetical protein
MQTKKNLHCDLIRVWCVPSLITSNASPSHFYSAFHATIQSRSYTLRTLAYRLATQRNLKPTPIPMINVFHKELKEGEVKVKLSLRLIN